MTAPLDSQGNLLSRPPPPPAHDIGTLGSLLKERMRPLVICLSRSWGGLEQISARDCLELQRLGIDVQVICLLGSPFHLHLQKMGVEAITLAEAPRDSFDLNLRKLLRQQVDEEGVNLIHVHQPNILASVVPWLWSRKNLVILASRHIMNSHNKKNPFHGLIYRRLDALIVMSESLRQNVLETHPLRERQVRVIHYGLDFSRFDPAHFENEPQRKEWGADGDTVVVGVVGRLDPMKGQDVFIKAAAGIVKNSTSPVKIKFVVVGEETIGGSSGYLDQLRQLVEDFQLQDHVVFTGFQEDVPKVMSALDIFVMPSRQEAFGLVAIEAMAMKCPVIISRGGSADEIAGPNQEYGLLVRPLDAFDLQNKIRFLLEHPETRARMGERACEYVRRNYDREVRLQNTLDLYERMLRRRGM